MCLSCPAPPAPFNQASAAVEPVLRYTDKWSLGFQRLITAIAAGVGADGNGGAVSAYNMTGAMLLSANTFRNNTATQGGILAVTDSPSVAVTMSNLTTADNTVRC